MHGYSIDLTGPKKIVNGHPNSSSLTLHWFIIPGCVDGS